jgi:NADPH:quinone reductase-like Zn-dependent oxidoreductase
MAVHDDEEEYASMYGESPWTTTPGNVLAQLNLALEERILLAGRASAVSPVLAAIIAEVGAIVDTAIAGTESDAAELGAYRIIDVLDSDLGELKLASQQA